MLRHLMTSIWLSQERKELSKWNEKHSSLFLKCSLLDIKNKLAKMQWTQPLSKLGFFMECFTAFLTFLAEKQQNLAFWRPAGYSLANSSITGIFLECPNFLRFHVLGHCVKSVQMRSYFWSAFCCIRTEYGEILSEYGKIRTRNNSVFGHFSCSELFGNS